MQLYITLKNRVFINTNIKDEEDLKEAQEISKNLERVKLKLDEAIENKKQEIKIKKQN